MQDGEPLEHGFVSPWFTTKVTQPANDDYFPNDYPVDSSLVTPVREAEDDD